MNDGPVYIDPSCEFCGANGPALLVPTNHGLICDQCVQVAVEIVMDAMARKPAWKNVNAVDNFGTKRKLAA
jgi:hypothetical protein